MPFRKEEGQTGREDISPSKLVKFKHTSACQLVLKNLNKYPIRLFIIIDFLFKKLQGAISSVVYKSTAISNILYHFIPIRAAFFSFKILIPTDVTCVLKIQSFHHLFKCQN